MRITAPISHQLSFWLSSFLVVILSINPVSAKDMTFKVRYLNHTNAIVADGEITADTPKNFSTFMESVELDGFKFEVWLNSDGGNLIAGLELGSLIRNTGFLDTVVHSENMSAKCYSACAYAFMGGREREVPDGARIGFHQFYSNLDTNVTYTDLTDKLEQSESFTQMLSALVLRYLLDMGADVELYYQMSFALPDQMFIPNTSDLLELGISTTSTFYKFDLDPYKKGVVAYSKNPLNSTGRQIVTQITTLCDHNQKLILLSAPEGYMGFDAASIKYFERQKPSFTVTTDNKSWVISYENLKAYRDTNVMLSILLPEDLVTYVEKGEFTGHWTIPAGMGPRLFFQASADIEGQKAIAASFRHCYR